MQGAWALIPGWGTKIPHALQYGQNIKAGLGTSLAVQWLRLHAPSAGGVGLIPGWVTKIPQAAQCDQREKKKKILLGLPWCLVVQWLRLRASIAGGRGSILGQGTKILHAVPCSQNNKKIPNGESTETLVMLDSVGPQIQ